ncbi:MAG: hypothetical protein ACM3NQ_16635, partial [Bacteroidales bacterium]
MSALSDDLLRIARRCADKLTLSSRGTLPALEDLDDECAAEIEEMLALLQDDEVFGEVDLNAQQKLVDQIEAALPEGQRSLVTELGEQHTRHVWLQQETAYHLGLAVGMKFAKQVAAAGRAEDEEGDELDEEDDEGDESRY